MDADRRQEQKIKNRLCNIELEEPESSHLKYPSYFALAAQKLKKTNSDYRQISDWASHLQLPLANATQRQKFLTNEEKEPKRLTFFATKRYPSSLLHQDKKNSRLELSPVVVKFNAKMLSQNLQQSKEKYIKKLKEDPYLTHYQSSSLAKNKRSKQQLKGPQFKQIKFEGSQREEKRERLTGILKLLKKEVPFRSRPHRPINPENFNATTRMF